MKSSRYVSSGAAAVGAIAFGAFAIGALAVGALAIRRLAIYKAAFKTIHIDELSVNRLHVGNLDVSESLHLPAGMPVEQQRTGTWHYGKKLRQRLNVALSIVPGGRDFISACVSLSQC